MRTGADMAQEMSTAWHDGGLFMGMHWLWWAVWVALIGALLAAFWRVKADRSATNRAIAEEEQAERVLRARFAGGEIDEDEFASKLKVLRESLPGR